MMKLILILPLVFVISCAMSSDLVVRTVPNHYSPWQPKGAVAEGTLTNMKLMQDTLFSAAVMIEAKGYRLGNSSSFSAFITSYPQGMKGQRSWQECWVFGKERRKVLIDFFESGANSSFVIQVIND